MAITAASLLAGVASAGVAASGLPLVALALWLTNRVLDGLDGEVARLDGRQSDLGGYADLLADFTVYALLPIGLAYAQQDPAVWRLLAWMLAAFYLNAGSWMLLAALLEKERQRSARPRTSLHMPTGLIEGAETALLYVLFLLFPNDLPLLFGLTALLVTITAAQRVVWAVRHLRAAS